MTAITAEQSVFIATLFLLIPLFWATLVLGANGVRPGYPPDTPTNKSPENGQFSPLDLAHSVTDGIYVGVNQSLIGAFTQPTAP